jgi:hypothetical protein
MADEVSRIGVVLDVADEVPVRPTIDAGGVYEMICGSSEGVDLKLVDVFLGDVADKPVNDEGALYPALAVKDQDDFIISRVFEGAFDKVVTMSCVLGVVEKGAPNEALDKIEEDPITDG